jgi:hypothetical protein
MKKKPDKIPSKKKLEARIAHLSNLAAVATFDGDIAERDRCRAERSKLEQQLRERN